MMNYYDSIYNFIRTFYSLPKKSFDKIYNISTFKIIKAGTKLVRQGEISNTSFFLSKGIARSYVIKKNGLELTKTIFTPPMAMASYASMLMNKASEFIYEALTECHIHEMNYNSFRKLCDEDIYLLKFYTLYMEALFISAENVFVEISTLDAKARYLKLRERIPGIDNLMAQYQIASYLNISPVQLSRIRAKL